MAKTEYEFYREERKNLIDAELEQASSFDKYILTLAAGTFGLSLLFIKDIVPHPEAGTIWLLVTAWAIFGASILSTLISFLLSQKAYREQRKILDNEYARKTKREQGENKNKFATYTHCLNWASMILFLVGVTFLIIFSAVNLLS
jgi:hypothetical protein